MKKTMMAIVALLFALASFGQTDIYRSAHFDGINTPAPIPTDWANISASVSGVYSSDVVTFQMWVKFDSVSTMSDEYLLDIPGGTVYASHDYIAAMYISHTDTTLHCIYGGNTNNIYTHLSFDTNWHHIAFICDTIAGHDTLSIFIDGVYQTGGVFAHTDIGNSTTVFNNLYVGKHILINISGALIGYDEYYYGNMCKFSIADSAIYDTIPDCVFDTTMFWSGGTISAPYTLLMALSNDSNYYFPNTTVGPDTVYSTHFTYTYGTSPCAPVYEFYCPAHIDSTVYARQTNKAYKKGANSPAHINGWTGVSTSITYGAFVDSMVITAAGSYPYMDDYHHIVTIDTTVVVSTTGIKEVYNINDIKIFPNPSTGNVNISVTDAVTLVVYDLTGRIVYNTNVSDKTMIHLSQGTYICTTTTNTTGVVHSAKILIQ